MTGHGSATAQDDQVQVLVEIRSVNNRFLKISVSGDVDADVQGKIEAMARARVQRGALNIRLQTQFLSAKTQYQLNMPQLEEYRKQLQSSNVGVESMAAVLSLPGIVTEMMSESKMETAWPMIESAAQQALENFVSMRANEGTAMLKDLLSNCDLIDQHVASIRELGPAVVEAYSNRVTERINRILQEHDVSVSASDVVREIGIFSEKVDTSEELVRLESHIQQFRSIANNNESSGRKLDFLTQELLRETNTIGSKANDAQIANHVVEMKTIIERIREMIQNAE